MAGGAMRWFTQGAAGSQAKGTATSGQEYWARHSLGTVGAVKTGALVVRVNQPSIKAPSLTTGGPSIFSKLFQA
jgi:hypothetical protein